MSARLTHVGWLLVLFLGSCRSEVHGRPTAAPSRRVVVPALPVEGTVVFLGDSISWQNGYPALIETYARRRYPARRLRFVNRGLRGDTVGGALARLDRDVLAYEPKLVLVMLGMNDGGYRPPNSRVLARYRGELGRLISRLREKSHAAIVLITPTCVLPQSYNNRRYNETLAAMAKEVLSLGRSLSVPVIDLFSHFRAKLAQAAAAKPPISLMLDAVHPGPGGHLLIAEYLLRHLDAAGRKNRQTRLVVPRAARRADGPRVSLPVPLGNVFVPPTARPAWGLLASQQRFNRQLLIVEGLEKPATLLLDGRELGTFSGERLAHGVDLNQLAGAPWVRRAEELHTLVERRWRWSYFLWDPKKRGWRAMQDVGGDIAAARGSRAAARERLKQLERAVRQHASTNKAYKLRLQLEKASPP